MNSVGQAAAPGTGRQPARRPSVWRKLGAAYLDFLFACFLGWVGMASSQAKDEWALLAAALLLAQSFICRAILKPTLGDFFMNIRYLTSSSNQVVADIRVVNPKVKMNGFLLVAGIGETTWAVFGLSAWTLFDHSASLGVELSSASSFLYYVVFGFLMLLSASSLLSGARTARWAVPGAHVVILIDQLVSARLWLHALSDQEVLWPWAEKAVRISPEGVSMFLLLFAVWSVILSIGIAFSRRHLVL
jgi:hypothetical protein